MPRGHGARPLVYDAGMAPGNSDPLSSTTAGTGNATADVLTVGEAMALLIAQTHGPLDTVAGFTRAAAGAELNVAVGLARLGLRVAYLTRLGDDSFGRYLRRFMDGEGIDTRLVAIDAGHPTGFMLKSLAVDGQDPAIEYHRKGSAASHMGPEAAADGLAGARHLHLSGVCPGVSAPMRELAFHLARRARQAGRSISFDPNLRPSLWPSEAVMVDTLNALAALADWVLPGLAEGERLTGRSGAAGVADFYLARGASLVVIKLGPQGASWFARDGSRGQAAGIAVPRVVDTVGAGDGFAVGLVSALLEGLPVADAVARANAIGARVVGFPGDSDGLPTRAELAQCLLAGNSAA
jgi:2-dehydro-3-deoxygluconokinase